MTSQGGTDDHGGTRNEATRVGPNSITQGRLDAEGDNDYFRFDVPSLGTVVAETTGDIDTTGVLEDASGRQIEFDDDDGANRNFRIERDLNPGTYYARVRGYRPSTTGSYALRISHAPHESEDDHGGTRNEATRVGPNSATQGSLEQGGDNDYFRFDVPSLGTVVAETTGDIDTTGVLEDASGQQIEFDDDDGADYNFRIERALNPGTYYARVRGYWPSTTGSYALRISHAPHESEDDHGGTRNEATRVGPNSATQGSLEQGGDNDYFRFDVPSLGTVVAETTGDIDTTGVLEDASGQQIEFDDDDGADYNFRIERALNPGTYYARVRGYWPSTTGSYALRVSHRPESATAGPGAPLGDFNRDGKADVLLRRSDGRWHYYPMDGRRVGPGAGSANLTRNVSVAVAGIGDMNGDGRDDVLMRRANGTWYYYPMSGRGTLSGRGEVPLSSDLEWSVAGIGDFDGDGRDDVLLRRSDGRWHYYPMDGRRVGPGAGSANLTRNVSVAVAGIGDMNGDGRDDVLMRRANGTWYYYPMSGRGTLSGRGEVPLSSDLEWSVAGIGDFDGDGRDDVLLRRSDGRWHYYPMDGRRVGPGAGSANLTRNVSVAVAGIGDMNGDGRDDVLMRRANGTWYYYPMSGRGTLSGRGEVPLSSDLEWSVAGAQD